MGISKETISRINELARKSKTTGLSPEEKEEQARLRREYIQAFHNNLRNSLNQISIQNPDGTITDLAEVARERNIR